MAALAVLAGCAALLLWRAEEGAARALTPPASVTQAPVGAATPASEPAAVAPEAASRAALGVAPPVDEDGPATPEPASPAVLLRGRVFAPDGAVLSNGTLQLYVEPFTLPGSSPSAEAEDWRRRAPQSGEGLRPDGILSAPHPSGHRLRLDTDGLGRFEAELPSSAREFGVRLHFELGDWRSGAAASLELEDLSTVGTHGEELGDVHLQRVEGELIAAGVVRGPDGLPAPGAEVRIMGVRRFKRGGSERTGWGGMLRVACDDFGAFEARGRVLEGEAAEGLRLYGSAEGLTTGSTTVEAVGVTGVVIVLGRAAGLEGRIEAGLAGPFPPGLTATLHAQPDPGVSPSAETGSRLRATVQPDGTFHFGSLDARRYALRFELRRQPLAFEVLDLEPRLEETLLDPRLQPVDLSAHLAVYELWVESAMARELEPVVVMTGKLPENAALMKWPVRLSWIGKFEQSAQWLDLAPPLRIAVEEPHHAPWLVDVHDRGVKLTARLASPAVLEVRIAGGLLELEPGATLHVRHYPWGANEAFRPDGTATLPIDKETHQHLLQGRGFELELMRAGGAEGRGLKTLEPRIGPRMLGPAEGTIEWTIELPPELLPVLAGQR